MEKKFLSAAGAQYTDPEKLRELSALIYEEAAIFDILGDFFYHSNIGIRRAAMEVRHYVPCILTYEYVRVLRKAYSNY